MAKFRNEEGVELELDMEYADLATRQGFILVEEKPARKKKEEE